jgi:hypothetical protein
MIERGKVEDFEVVISNSLPIDQKVLVRDFGGNDLICHEIFPIGPKPFLSFFQGDTKDLESKNYHMFGSVMGYPNTSSVSNIPEGFRESEKRFIIYLLAFKEFYAQYFESCIDDTAFLLYLHDFSFDSWNRDNVHRLIECLNREGVPVSLELEGNSREGVYHTLLLFERGGNTVLD